MKHAGLYKCAWIAVKTCLAVKTNEDVLVVTDTSQSMRLTESFMAAIHAAGAEALMFTYTPRAFHSEEPLRTCATAMRSADAIILLSSKSVTNTWATAKARKVGARVLSLPGISEETFLRTVPIDYHAMQARLKIVAGLFAKAKSAHVYSDLGTDLTMQLDGRAPYVGTGICRNLGDLNHLPAGFVEYAPLEGTAKGRLVIEASLWPPGLLSSPIHLTISRGRITRIEGRRDADVFRRGLESLNDPNIFSLAEIGVGTNPKAKLTGAAVEDERIVGNVHIGFGDNKKILGGNIEARGHTDGVMLTASLRLDNQQIIKAGKLLV